MAEISSNLISSILSTVDADTTAQILNTIPGLKVTADNIVFMQEVWRERVAKEFDIRNFGDMSADWRFIYMILDKQGIEDSLSVIDSMMAYEALKLILLNTHLPVKFLDAVTRAIRKGQADTLSAYHSDPRAVAEISDALKLEGADQWNPICEYVKHNSEGVYMIEVLLSLKISTLRDVRCAAVMAARYDRRDMFDYLIGNGIVDLNYNDGVLLIEAAVNFSKRVLYYLQTTGRMELIPRWIIRAAIKKTQFEDVKEHLSQF